MKLKDLVMHETGVAFDKIDLGHGKATLQDAAEHTLTDMQREFIQTVKQAHKKDYTSISEISETITLRQMITMVIHPDAVFLLQKYSALTQKMVELQQTEEMTLKDVLVTFTGLSINIHMLTMKYRMYTSFPDYKFCQSYKSRHSKQGYSKHIMFCFKYTTRSLSVYSLLWIIFNLFDFASR